MTRDPVCGTEVEPKKAHSMLEHGGYVFCFCSRTRKEEFEKNPRKCLSKMHAGV